MSVRHWATSAHPASGRFEAWRQALDDSHLEWELDAVSDADFQARIRERRVDDLRLVECRCDPCQGQRGRAEIGRSDEAYFGILFELSGRETTRQGDTEALLGPGDFVMWDSERAMEFRVHDRLHKFTLLVPKPRMDAVLHGAHGYAGTVVRGADRNGAIASSALARLARDFHGLGETELSALTDPILGLVAAAMTANRPSDRIGAHEGDFRRFCRYAERHLGDGSLDPARIAAAHAVSVRYLHLVFAEQGTTVGRWIRERRLANCRRDLVRAGAGVTITEIAFRWGFNDMAHFSRLFKARFGVSARAVVRSGRLL
ncbi:helix-turn-helix domain-containing protein [Methyloraptor flagellatus]|uniref:Helix-turn-helix domain-containing protein n=1 Tax=Methyloraptor flagellatus TaxID=3162530 RepID=A0AAU7XBH1_9HYPH